MIYETLIQLNNRNKIKYKDFVRNNVDDSLLRHSYYCHAFNTIERNGRLYIENKVDFNNKTRFEIESIVDLFNFYEQSNAFIVNFSDLYKYKDIIEKFELSYDIFIDLKCALNKIQNGHVLSFVKVSDIDSYISKMILLGGKVLLNLYPIYIICKGNDIIVVSEYTLLLKNKTNFTLSNIDFKIISLKNVDISCIDKLDDMFSYCKNTEKIILENFDTKNIYSFKRMFYKCVNLKSVTVNHFDMSSCEYIDVMFCDCKSLRSLNISNWVTSNLKSMINFISGCISLEGIDVSGLFYCGHKYIVNSCNWRSNCNPNLLIKYER